MTDASPPPSLDLIYQEVKERLNAQLQQVDALDTKAAFVVSTASIVISIAGGLPVAFAGAFAAGPVVMFGAAMVLYGLAMFTGIRAYWVRSYRRDPEPGPLMENYLHTEPESTKEQVIANLVESFNKNAKIIDRKAYDVSAAMIFLTLETLALAGAMIVQAVIEGG